MVKFPDGQMPQAIYDASRSQDGKSGISSRCLVCYHDSRGTYRIPMEGTHGTCSFGIIFPSMKGVRYLGKDTL